MGVAMSQEREADAVRSGMPPSKDSIDLWNATEAELLAFTVRFLERIRAHPRLGWAVGRAALRLVDQKEGNGHA